MVKPDIVTATTSAKVEYKDTRVLAHSSITPIEIQHVCTNSSNKRELLRSLMVGQKTYLGTTNNRPEFSQAPGIRSQTSLFIKLCVCLSYSYISILVCFILNIHLSITTHYHAKKFKKGKQF